MAIDTLNPKTPDSGPTIQTISRRPVPVIAVGYLFAVTGIIGFFYHLPDLLDPDDSDAAWVLALRVLAVVGGMFVMRGANWARWLLVGWLAYHVVLGALHSMMQFAVHAALLVVIAYVLFRRRASSYFARGRQP